MNIVITGHTGGLGRAIYFHFKNQGHTVEGLSRSNGFGLPEKYDEALDIASKSEVFINNAFAGDTQAKFIQDLAKSNVKIITIGSVAADWAKYTPSNDYRVQKLAIEKCWFSYKPVYHNRCLLIKPGYLEHTANPQFQPIAFTNILDSIDFWFSHPRMTQIEFDNIKLI